MGTAPVPVLLPLLVLLLVVDIQAKGGGGGGHALAGRRRAPLYKRLDIRAATSFDVALKEESLLYNRKINNDDTLTSPVSGAYLGFTQDGRGCDQRVDIELAFNGGIISGRG
eukprot:scaffold4940_cov163-Amphora_coffeaeformis.AAC.4